MRLRPVHQFLLLAVFLIAGCTNDLRIRTELGRDAELSGYRTYDWLIAPQPSPGAVPIDPDLINQMVREALGREFSSRGYRHDAEASPDFLVFFHAGADDVERVAAVHRDRAGGTVSAPTRYRTGELVIELSDTQTGALAWRGRAQAEILRGVSLDERRARIDRAVRELLERFPSREP
jgi:hypothetical protein